MKIYDVFISYRRSDGLIIAEALYKYLTSKGLRVFFDKHEMIDGHYFTTQIETNLKIAPNYILIATDDVFKFRKNEDWVRNEIEVAIEEYESNPIERTLTVLVPESVTFPEKEVLPKSVCNIADAQRIALPYGEDFAEPFYKTLKAVTNINRRNLWFAAHRWLENSKQPGGRFASLNINESILPNASKNKTEQKEMPINVYGKDNVSENRQSLLDAMGCNSNHLYLIGQGGIGKTTALMHIMNNAYVDKQYPEKAQIPLFVELSFAPDTYGALYEGGKSTFIRRSIYKQVRADRTIKQVTTKEVSDVDEVFSSLPYDVAVQPITDILSKTTPAPEYLLLLDGLNEVSSVTIEETGLSVVQMIMREIDLLISECPNVRVVLTSRSDESTIYSESISRLYLSGVEDTEIKNYLENCELSKEQIDKTLEDENLHETLQIPLFLTMYASLSKYDEVSTQGEILKLFFNERRRNISVYTMQERISQVEKNVTDVASAVQKNRIDADMQNFILDFILPEIAWFLERNGEFYLSVRSIRKIVEPILVDTDDLAFCGEFGREIFSKYRNGASAKMHTYKVAKKILERLGDDITEVNESIINCCVFALGVMQESNGKYGFVHQHIRDYFAALKNINTIRLSVYLYEENEKDLALECMNKTFKDEPVNYTVRRFMGEYLGEHRNKPFYADGKWNYGVPTEKCDRNLIKRALDIYRGYFDGECGYGVYSFIEIIKNNRKDLSGSDFSNLDFTFCFLGNSRMSHENISTCFRGAKISGNVFITDMQSFSVDTIVYSPDNSTILSNCDDGVLRVWDAKSYKLLGKIEGEQKEGKITSARFSLDGKKLILTIQNKIIRIFESKTLKHLCDQNIDFYTDLTKNTLNMDCFVKTYYREAFLFSSEQPNNILLLDNIKQMFFICNAEKIATVSYDSKNVVIRDAKSFTIEKEFEIEDYERLISVNKDYIVVLKDEKILFYSFDSLKLEWEICKPHQYIGRIGLVSLSENGEYIIICGKEWYDDTIVWSIKKRCIVGVLPREESSPKYVTFSTDSKLVAVVKWSGNVNFWDCQTLNCVGAIDNYQYGISSLDYSEDKKRILASFKDGNVYVWNITNGTCEGIIEATNTSAVAFTKDNRYIIVGNEQGIFKLYDSNTLQCIRTSKRNFGKINSIICCGKYISISSQNAIVVIDSKSLGVVCVLSIDYSCVCTARFAPFDDDILLISLENGVHIFDINRRKTIYHLKEYLSEGNYAIFNPNGTSIASFSDDNGLKIWDAHTFYCLERLDDDFHVVNDVAYSSNGDFIAVASASNNVEIWDANFYKNIGTLVGHDSGVYSVIYANKDKNIITASSDKKIKIWDASSFECIKTIKAMPGLLIHKVDFRNIHFASNITAEEKDVFRQYGAIID